MLDGLWKISKDGYNHVLGGDINIDWYAQKQNILMITLIMMLRNDHDYWDDQSFLGKGGCYFYPISFYRPKEEELQNISNS